MAAAGAAPKLHLTRAPPLSPPPPPTLFPSPGHPARPTPGGEQGKIVGRPLLFLWLSSPHPFPAVLPSGSRTPEEGRGGGGRGRRRHCLRPGSGQCCHPPSSRTAAPPPRPLAQVPTLSRDPRSLGPHHCLLGNKWFRSIPRPKKQLLGRSLGETRLWAPEGEEEV